jgi:hypothetical protein
VRLYQHGSTGLGAVVLGAGYRSGREEVPLLHELVLAIGIPLVLLLLAVLALERWGDRLPPWLQRLAERPSWLWNAGIGLIIGLSLLRWLLQR